MSVTDERCPASGLAVDQYRLNGDGVLWCPTCCRYATAEPVDESLRVWRIDDHRPRLDPRGKPGIHGPECVDHDDTTECVCVGVAARAKAGLF